MEGKWFVKSEETADNPGLETGSAEIRDKKKDKPKTPEGREGGAEFAGRMRSEELEMMGGILSKINKVPKALKMAVMGLTLGTVFSSVDMALPKSAEAMDLFRQQGVFDILRGGANKVLEAKRDKVQREYAMAQNAAHEKVAFEQTRINNALVQRQTEINTERINSISEIQRDNSKDEATKRLETAKIDRWSNEEAMKIQNWAQQERLKVQAEYQNELHKASKEYQINLWKIGAVETVIR